MLHPLLQAKCHDLLDAAKKAGIELMVTGTLRTKAEQEALYAQGRSKPGKIVTRARYPYSLHCWGLAFDIAVVRDGKADWDAADLYEKVGKMGTDLGLVWGGNFKSFKDMTHFELAGYDPHKLLNQWRTPDAFIASYRQKPEERTLIDIEGHWAQKAIEQLKERGIVQPAERFHPDQPATRAEVAVMLAQLIKDMDAKKEK